MIRRPPRSTLFSLHDALPILLRRPAAALGGRQVFPAHLLPRADRARNGSPAGVAPGAVVKRSEEHTSELQSQSNIVCRLLLEKKKSAILPYLRPTSIT